MRRRHTLGDPPAEPQAPVDGKATSIASGATVRGADMHASNIVRMRVKRGFVEDYLTLHRERRLEDMPGMVALNLVPTGERNLVRCRGSRPA
jgi:hypothetical protein